MWALCHLPLPGIDGRPTSDPLRLQQLIVDADDILAFSGKL